MDLVSLGERMVLCKPQYDLGLKTSKKKERIEIEKIFSIVLLRLTWRCDETR
jgi:hypothetical protein